MKIQLSASTTCTCTRRQLNYVVVLQHDAVTENEFALVSRRLDPGLLIPFEASNEYRSYAITCTERPGIDAMSYVAASNV